MPPTHAKRPAPDAIRKRASKSDRLAGTIFSKLDTNKLAEKQERKPLVDKFGPRDKCEWCFGELEPRKFGRQQRFCKDKCRKAAARAAAGPGPETLGPHNTPGHRNGPGRAILSGNGRNSARKSRDQNPNFPTFPLDILGRSSRRGLLPVNGIDPKVRERILWCEVGRLDEKGGAQ